MLNNDYSMGHCKFELPNGIALKLRIFFPVFSLINDSSPSLEIISNIVEQLDDNKDRYSLALVNRFFYHETNPILWRSPTITSSSSTGGDDGDEEANTITAIRFIVCVMEARHLVALQVRKLDLGDYIWSDAELLLVTRRLSLLEELNINNEACLSNISLGCLPRHCPNLTSFRLLTAISTRQLCSKPSGQEMQHMDGDTVVDVVDPATATSTTSSKRRSPVDQLDRPASWLATVPQPR
ncbi:hypothetical protein BCR42DRAFT_426315 [Absidia repens]|uniref:Uncharacterized protein n=1 Tax=Absidia repens TaxID=90262 RepID=A0A1X2I228_9FUNG|nr:hypothetical protein BCR42DRAFT_426315 [Absidia repens]